MPFNQGIPQFTRKLFTQFISDSFDFTVSSQWAK